MNRGYHIPYSVEIRVGSGLFLGNYAALKGLRELGVTHNLSVLYSGFEDVPSAGYTKLAIKLHDHPSSNILSYLHPSVMFILNCLASGGKCFVHCQMGISRSATVIAAFLMIVEGLDAATALDQLKRMSPRTNPNSGFRRQLKEFESLLKCGIFEGLIGDVKWFTDEALPPSIKWPVQRFDTSDQENAFGKAAATSTSPLFQIRASSITAPSENHPPGLKSVVKADALVAEKPIPPIPLPPSDTPVMQPSCAAMDRDTSAPTTSEPTSSVPGLSSDVNLASLAQATSEPASSLPFLLGQSCDHVVIDIPDGGLEEESERPGWCTRSYILCKSSYEFILGVLRSWSPF